MIIAKDLSNFNELANKFRIRAAAAAQKRCAVFFTQLHDFCKFGRLHIVLCLSLGIDDGISGVWFA